MNILCSRSKQLSMTEFSGWGKAFISCGHNFLFFLEKEKAILDAFYEKNPNIFITHEDILNRPTKKAINNYSSCKTIIFCKDDTLKSQKIFHDNVFYVYPDSDILYPSLDVYSVLRAKIEPRFISDINYVGEYVDVEDNVFLNMLSNKGFVVKIWGEKKWPYVQYLGKIKEPSIKNIIRSASLSVYSDLFSDFGWFLKVFSCDKPCFAYKSKKSFDIIKASNFNYDDEDDFLRAIIDFLQNPESVEEQLVEIKNEIMYKHTAHSRVCSFFEMLGMKEESEKCHTELQKILTKYVA